MCLQTSPNDGISFHLSKGNRCKFLCYFLKVTQFVQANSNQSDSPELKRKYFQSNRRRNSDFDVQIHPYTCFPDVQSKSNLNIYYIFL